MGVTGQKLVERLEVEDSDVVFVTALLRTNEGVEHVIAASAVVGPMEMRGLSWPEWLEINHDSTTEIGPILAHTSRPLPWWTEYDFSIDDWRFVRFELPLDNLQTWIEDLFEHATFKDRDNK